VQRPGATEWEREFRLRKRFAFGENWTAFLHLVNPERVRRAEESLKEMLGVDRLDGKRFLDAGSGSGLFSLAARRLGATVLSFDYDPNSVDCALKLRESFCADDPQWRVEQGSVLDLHFLDGLGEFDVVYSWGVLHHTGSMWQALDNIIRLVGPRGQLFIAIYNDQGWASAAWRGAKRLYVGLPVPLRWVVLLPALLRLWGPTIAKDTLRGNPVRSWKSYSLDPGSRGMHPWRDAIDWVGGYPFEVATPQQVIDFCSSHGLDIDRANFCGRGRGCNEYVFRRRTEA
jgi:2-polyprenyl-6-hydroxyphenyl methylase/3-demethylubiquinone-9 3-methyltransferase